MILRVEGNPNCVDLEPTEAGVPPPLMPNGSSIPREMKG